MNILFIYSIYDIKSSKKPLRTFEDMQFGISYISSLLKESGHNTKLIVLSRMLGSRNYEIVDKAVNDFTPVLVCFTAVSSEYRFVADIAGYIKRRHPSIYLLAGGAHVSLNPDEAILDSFDAICIGEGEYASLEVVAQLSAGDIPSKVGGLWIKNKSSVEKNSPRPFLDDLDSLPFPDRQMWVDFVDEDKFATYPILLGRGCPFECTYCCNHAIKKITSGRYVRLRKVDSILSEIRYFVLSNPDKRNIYLEVETIGIDSKWVLKLCASLKDFNLTTNKPLSFATNLRITPNVDYFALFKAFSESNFRYINIGVESGSERVRREVLNRNYTNQEIIDVVSLARKFDLSVNFYNLIGIPGETLNDFKETLKLNRICQPDIALTHIFFPYPGTRLHSLCKERGLLNKHIDTRMERSRSVLDLPGFSKKQIQKEFIFFDYNVYKGHRPMLKILIKTLITFIRSNFHLHNFYRKMVKFRLAKHLFGGV